MISNCLFYALSQKIKNKELKILILSRKFTKSFFPHFFVYNSKNNTISHFAHINKTCSLLYKGKIKRGYCYSPFCISFPKSTLM